jgi:hypothetical protein
MTLPDRSIVPVQPMVGAEGAEVRFRGTEQTGVYTLTSDGVEIDRFAVNLDPAESDTRGASDETLMNMLPMFDPSAVSILDADDLLIERIAEARFGSELRTMLIILAIATALAELWVASTRKEQPQETLR